MNEEASGLFMAPSEVLNAVKPSATNYCCYSELLSTYF